MGLVSEAILTFVEKGAVMVDPYAVTMWRKAGVDVAVFYITVRTASGRKAMPGISFDDAEMICGFFPDDPLKHELETAREMIDY